VALEYCTGGSLAQRLGGTPLPAAAAARLAETLARAVQAALDGRVVHRDLKPVNVLLTGPAGGTAGPAGPEGSSPAEGTLDPAAWGTAKVSDFGLAKKLDEAGPTQSGAVLGTPSYMAPEQARGLARAVGPAADVYALGAILYELLTGRPPFKAASVLETLAQVVADEPVPVRRLQPAVPRGLETVCLKCLEKDPRRRYPSARALAEDLGRFGAGEPVAARPVGAAGRALRWARRRPAAAALLAAAMLLVLGGVSGGLWWAWQRAEQARQREEQERAVQGILDEVAESLRHGKLPEARAALGRAEGRVAGGGPADLRRRVQQMRDDLDLVDALDRIRLRAAAVVEGKLDYASADRGYAAEFQERGLAEEGEDPQAVADRLRGSAVRAQLVAALDHWAVVTDHPARRGWLLEVARRTDPGAWGDRFRDPAVWAERAALEQLALEADVAELSPQLLTALGLALRRRGADPLPLLTAAQARHPADFWVNFHLGNALLEAKRQEEAVGYYRAALAVRPETSAVHNNLGNALRRKGRLDDAIQAYRTAIALDPKYAGAHTNLGIALHDQGRLDDAIREFRQAIALDPNLAGAHNNLGTALKAQGRTDDAIQEYRRALDLDPKFAGAHAGLGAALRAKGLRDDAIQEYRRAIALDPRLAVAHYNLGNALRDKGLLDEAVAAYRTAIGLDPKYAQAHHNLGLALYDKGRLDDAIREYRKAIELDPKHVWAHHNLGLALQDKGRLDDAIREYRRAIELDPKLAQAHGALGQALPQQGRFAEARAATLLCLDLLPPHHPLRGPAAEQLRQCDRFLALDQKLPALLQGQAKPADAAERLALAQLCRQYKQLYAAATRFYAEAFADQPGLAEDLQAGHRYHAACAAALAGGGQGKDADQLDDQERARLRRQALGWLRADLAAWTQVVDKAPPQARPAARQALQHWRKDPDLAGLRDPGAVAKLPEAERQACRQLWADVEALLRKARQ
jgi:serine/threonine-protein kinase